MSEHHDDPFSIFDEVEFEDIDAGNRKEPIRVRLKKVSTGVLMRLIISPDVVEEMGIKAGDCMKLQGANLGDDIAFKISKSKMDTQIVARKNTVGARKDDKADLGLIINFNRMNDFGAAAFQGCPDPSNRRVKDGALLLILPAGENPVIAKKVQANKKAIPSSGINPSGIVFSYYANGRFKPTVESDEILEKMVMDQQKSLEEVSAHFGNQVPADDLKRRLGQLRDFGRD